MGIPCSNDKEIKKELNKYINNFSNSFKKFIEQSFLENRKKYNWDYDVERWKNEIIKYIDDKFNIKNKEIKKKIEDFNYANKCIPDKNKKEKKLNQNYRDERRKNLYKIDNLKKNNILMSIEIQNKYSVIIDDFKIFSKKYYDDNEEIENQTFGHFLIKIANISRMSLNHSNHILEKLYSENEKSFINSNDIIISSLEQFREEFSSWVKNNWEFVEKELEKYFNKNEIPFIEEEKDIEAKNYFKKLYKELTILYFQCEISFPLVQVNFDNNEMNFDSEKMTDYPHNSGNKKINFVYFPSLISNNNYLKNGKQWVFTYIESNKKTTFYFKKTELKIEPASKQKFFIPKLSDKLKLEFYIDKCLIPKINYQISDKVRKEYIFYFKDKNTHEEYSFKGDSPIEYDENLKLIKCDFYLMSEFILSCEY